MSSSTPTQVQNFVWHAAVILFAVGLYAYFADAPVRKFHAVCSSVQVGTDVGSLRHWAITNGADPDNTRWNDQTLAISFRVSLHRYYRTCYVHTQDGKVSAVSWP